MVREEVSRILMAFPIKIDVQRDGKAEKNRRTAMQSRLLQHHHFRDNYSVKLSGGAVIAHSAIS